MCTSEVMTFATMQEQFPVYNTEQVGLPLDGLDRPSSLAHSSTCAAAAIFVSRFVRLARDQVMMCQHNALH